MGSVQEREALKQDDAKSGDEARVPRRPVALVRAAATAIKRQQDIPARALDDTDELT